MEGNETTIFNAAKLSRSAGNLEMNIVWLAIWKQRAVTANGCMDGVETRPAGYVFESQVNSFADVRAILCSDATNAAVDASISFSYLATVQST